MVAVTLASREPQSGDGAPEDWGGRRYAARFPWAESASIDTYFAMSRTFSAVFVALLGRPMPGGWQLNRAQYDFLAALYLTEDYSLALSDVAREMNVTNTYVTKLMDSLEDAGLVERAPSLSDRRVRYARLTPLGLKCCASAIPAFIEFMEEVGGDTSAAEKLELRRLLTKYYVRARAIENSVLETD